jgi:hypothetical protein
MILNIQPLDYEAFLVIARLPCALTNFFKILQEQNVKPEDYDHTLRTIAERYLNLLKEVAALQSEDPEVKALLTQAEQVLKQGEFDQAEALVRVLKVQRL